MLLNSVARAAFADAVQDLGQHDMSYADDRVRDVSWCISPAPRRQPVGATEFSACSRLRRFSPPISSGAWRE